MELANLEGKGKVRDVYDVGDNFLVLVTTDRISAFDSVLPCQIPNKGVVLNRLSEFWFDYTQDIIKNHMISTDNLVMPEEFQTKEYQNRCMLVKKLKMIPIECIVRGYITGSGWESYQKDGKVCGIELPSGLRESEQLPEPIYTPTTKAEEDHDEHISFEDTIGMIGEDMATKLRNISIDVYSKCAEYAKTKGIIIADTKFEFGISYDGSLILADELMTPDSSRFWPASEYEVGKSQQSFDKQFVRDYMKKEGIHNCPENAYIPENIIEATSNKYIEAYETLTGKTF